MLARWGRQAACPPHHALSHTGCLTLPTQASPAELGLAFGLVLAAGASTALGASLVFCSRLTDHRLLAGSLGASAGVMM